MKANIEIKPNEVSITINVDKSVIDNILSMMDKSNHKVADSRTVKTFFDVFNLSALHPYFRCED
jgi:hypothetical protein